LITIGLLLVNQKKSKDRQNTLKTKKTLGKTLTKILTQKDADSEESRLPLKRMILSKKFVTIYILALCHGFYGYYFLGIWKIYGKEFI
jgi:hypothetical protein